MVCELMAQDLYTALGSADQLEHLQWYNWCAYQLLPMLLMHAYIRPAVSILQLRVLLMC